MTLGITRIRAALALCLALVLAFRVVAVPWVMAAPAPGLMAICTGGQITYVSIDGTPVPEGKKQSEDCPLLGVTVAVLGDAPQLPLREIYLVPGPALSTALLLAAGHAYATPPARAPPLFG